MTLLTLCLISLNSFHRPINSPSPSCKYQAFVIATTVLEILTHIDLTSDMSDNDIDELYEELVNAGFYEPLIKKYINTYSLNDQEVESCINDYARIKHGLK